MIRNNLALIFVTLFASGADAGGALLVSTETPVQVYCANHPVSKQYKEGKPLLTTNTTRRVDLAWLFSTSGQIGCNFFSNKNLLGNFIFNIDQYNYQHPDWFYVSSADALAPGVQYTPLAHGPSAPDIQFTNQPVASKH